MKFRTVAAGKAIRCSLEAMGGLSSPEIDEAVFHLLDWENDLAEYAAFLRSPDDYDDDEISALLIRFLAHVPAHVSSAADILLNLSDERRTARPRRSSRARRKEPGTIRRDR